MAIDLFGNKIVEDVLLRDRFLEPPFSVMDTKTGTWQIRKRNWIEKGIKSEVGRGAKAYNDHAWLHEHGISTVNDADGTSIFDPALTELMYRWFCPDAGTILDPFAGGSVRGIVAHYLGYKYTGLELREEQVASNVDQAQAILASDNQPKWIVGDSDTLMDGKRPNYYDMIFSCPPYFDLEVYSDLPDDLSHLDWEAFRVKYTSIIKKAIGLLKPDHYAVWVVGEIRDKKGFYRDFVGLTKRAFIDNGAGLYNDAIILNSVGSAAMRAGKQFEAGKKLCTKTCLCSKRYRGLDV
jgi:DNA modification methylase